MAEKFDVIVVGSGFAGSFFLQKYLEKAQPDTRVLVLERGKRDDKRWQLENLRSSSVDPYDTFVNPHPEKVWFYTPGFGGSSNCWWACTPRMMPADFQLQSRYGIGLDWPVSYDDLEAYYTQIERTMAVSGPDDGSPFPRSEPYPQPPHLFNEPDKILKAAYPDLYYQQPTARSRVNTEQRPMCCASGVCHLCPIDATFTVRNGMYSIYNDPRVTLELEAAVQTIDRQGAVATGVHYVQDGAVKTAQADLIVLAANALFNPHILLRSGFTHPALGAYLHEQVSVYVLADLDGLENFQGSTSITANGYMLYDGAHRSQRAAALMESANTVHHDRLRLEPGKWRQRLVLKFLIEDLPREENYVRVYERDPMQAETVYVGHSDYAQRTIDALPTLLPDLLTPLPVEDIHYFPINPTENHIQGTTRMGNDPTNSVVDRHLVHHQVRNLLILGSSVYPTCAPANPTLTIAALSSWAADHL